MTYATTKTITPAPKPPKKQPVRGKLEYATTKQKEQKP